ncbi:hypothetical protein TCAL_15584 [Tigriopus californicus]|uniref:Uncharacterized protein n=2 Tax=Tigriopus californicus TaxID=6832 RepID=A0A553PDP5_TIGCA|nr:hypothetical protein TCAL_15584 [Tigriopus californicus]
METTLYHRSQQQPRDLKESKSPMNV